LISCVLTAAAITAMPAVAAGQSRGPSVPGSPGSDDKKLTPQPPNNSDQYRLGPGDKLRIEVYRDAQLSQSVQVRPDGKITLPLVGDIDVTSKTPLELRDYITNSLKEYMNNPVVTVIVVEATASIAYVMGEVNHPGVVNLQAPMTVLQALAVAGGLKDFADQKNIMILRKGPNASIQRIAFNYKDAIKGSGPQIYLKPGDTVVVPD
jgi:polysaccharide export outer membrane protein